MSEHEDMMGFAVLRHWPDGAHDIFGLRDTAKLAKRAADRDKRYWRRGPIRPARYRVVAVSEADYRLHRGCRERRSPDCP